MKKLIKILFEILFIIVVIIPLALFYGALAGWIITYYFFR